MNTNRFYVYCLIDPRNGDLFYVGKGTGARMHGHLKAVRGGHKDHNQFKGDRIRAIVAAGLEPFAFKAADGLEEADALALEHRLIMGLDRLTNILSTGWARSPAQLERIKYRQDTRDIAARWHQKTFAQQRRTFWDAAARGLKFGFRWPSGQWDDLTAVFAEGLRTIEARLIADGYSRDWVDGSTH